MMADEQQVVYPKDVLARVQEWPTQIRCHQDDWQARHYQPDGLYEWGKSQLSAEDEDWCRFCGSISPRNLMTYLAAGADLHGADWKYGWPHKFYISGKGVPRGQVKWNNKHLLDLDDDTFAEFSEILMRYSGIYFARMKDNRAGTVELGWRAPYHGYQR